MLPTFRPDALVYLDRPTWRADIAELANVSGIDTTTYDGFLDALRQRRQVFVEAGARATDHGHLLADTTPMDAAAARGLYSRVLGGADPTAADVTAFAANMLFQMAEMACEDGLVMQIHPGVLRDHNTAIAKTPRVGQGPRHPDPDRVHPCAAADAGAIRHRSRVSPHPLHR